MDYYNEELFAQQTPYLQWLKEQDNQIVRRLGKRMRRLPFYSCRDRLADIVGETVRGDIKEDTIYIFQHKDGAELPNIDDEIANAFMENKDAQLVYADEDYLGSLTELYGLEDDGALYRGAPWFKPDYSPDTLDSFFYIGSIFAITGVMLKSGIEKNLNIYELVRLAADMDRKKVIHIPKVLYTNNSLEGVDELEGQGVIEEKAEAAGGLVSIIIPSRDNSRVLRKCLDTLTERTRYEEYEIIIVDNGSSDEERAALDKLFSELKAKKSNLGIEYIYDEKPFNFSIMCNTGAKAAKGKYLLFLNDDTEILEWDWLEKMVRSAALSHVGAVGAKLYYPKQENSDGYLLQHVGITNMGIGPAHKLGGLEDKGNLYHGHNIVTYNMLAVTAACMLVERSRFDQAGGFDEELAVAYNDVELCFRLYKAGYYNLVRNDAVLIHHESLSRGQDITDKKQKRLEIEKRMLFEKHPDMDGKDPFYSPNLVQWKRDIEYNTGYLYPCDREVLPVRLDEAELKTLPKAHKNKYIRRLTGESLSMLTIDNIKTGDINTPHYRTERLASITGWYVIRGKNNALVDRAVLLRNVESYNAIYVIPVYPQLRRDVEELFEKGDSTGKTRNTALAGIRVIFNCMALVEGNYEIGVLATVENERRGYIEWSGRTIKI